MMRENAVNPRALPRGVRADADEVREAACGHWLDILSALGPALAEACGRVGKHVPCPVHGGRDGFRLFSDAAQTGGGVCNTCGDRANGFAVLQWVNNWDFPRTLEEVAGFLRLGCAAVAVRSAPRPAEAQREAGDEAARRRRLEALWGESEPDPGRVAEYLRHRGLAGVVPCTLRLHPALGYFDDKAQHLGNFPAVLAQVQRLDGEVAAILRTYLDPAGPGKAPVDKPKKLTPSVRAGATRGAAIHLAEPGETLALAEGIETALAVMEATGVPAWAGVSAGGLEAVELPPHVHQVKVWADHDASGVGQQAAASLAARLHAKGKRVLMMVPPREGEDWLDVLNEAGPDALRAAQAGAVPWEPGDGAEAEDAAGEEEAPPGVAGEDVAPLPTEVLPGMLARFVEEAAEAIPCPTDFVAVPLLALAGAAIGTSRVLQIKPGWREGPRLYAPIVADPGSGKSPALDLVARPVYERQKVLAGQFEVLEHAHKDEIARYEVELRTWEERARLAAKGKGADPGPKPEEPAGPTMARVFTGDTTVEALAGLMRDNPRGLALIRDELTGWVRGMNQYKAGKGADKQFYLSAWSGAPYPVDRKSGPPVLLFDPFLNVVGCIPPDLLDELTDERGREDGFVHRLLFAYPDAVPRRWTETTVSEEAQNAWRRALDALWRLEPAVDRDGKPEPVALPFSEEGKRAWVEFCDAHYSKLADPSFPVHLRGAWAKLDGYCARLALILQELRRACGEANSEAVDTVSVTGAWALVDYFKNHARRVYRRLRADADDKRAEGAANWIKARGGECRARDLIAYGVAGVKKASQAQKLLEDLVDRGLGRLEERPPRGGRGRPSTWFALAQ